MLFVAAVLTVPQTPLSSGGPTELQDAIVGRWTCSGRFVRSGRPIASTIEIKASGVDGTLLVHHVDRPPDNYRSIELWSPGDVKGQATIADKSGMRWFNVSRLAGALVLDRSDTAGPIERFAYTIVGGNLKVDWSHRDRAGLLVAGDTLLCSQSTAG